MDFHWYKISITLRSTHVISHYHKSMVEVYSAIVKSHREELAIHAHHLLFFINSEPYQSQIALDREYPIEMYLSPLCEAKLSDLVELIHTYSYQNLDLIEPPQWEKVQWNPDNYTSYLSNTLCLQMLEPLHFNYTLGKSYHYIDSQQFVRLIQARIQHFIGTSIDTTGLDTDFEINYLYWRYRDTKKRKSSSEPKGYQIIRGGEGRLYFQGDLTKIYPYLVLCTQIGVGGKMTYSQGYCRILPKPTPTVDHSLFDRKRWKNTVEHLCERNERFEQEFSLLIQHTTLDYYLDALINEIKNQCYQPSPSQIRTMVKEDGSERSIELLATTDVLVHTHLLRILRPLWEHILEDESIGSRRGLSRLDAIQRIHLAFSEGYTHYVKADIQDFYPQIDLARLEMLIDRYLPAENQLIRALLMTCMKNDSIKDHRLTPRQRGLAQGRPISSLLANIYLDDFDEALKRHDIRYIRYMDDLLLLTRHSDSQSVIFQSAVEQLSTIGLSLDPAKTAMGTVAEGFEYLGCRFKQGEVVDTDVEEIKLLKKPVYITEPHVMLSIHGESIEVWQGEKKLASFPLARISELILLEQAIDKTNSSLPIC